MNKPTLKNILFILAFLVSQISLAQKQEYFGGMIGPSLGRFVDFSGNDDYESHYNSKIGGNVLAFYQTRIDSTTSFRIGIQYQYQQAKFEVRNHAGNASYYNNTNYTINQIKLNLDYYLQLMNKKTFGLQFLFGVSGGYNFNTYAKGEGWDMVNVTQTDTSGNNISVITEKPWHKNERNSKDLNPLFLQLDLGLAASIPINDRIDFILQNDYSLCVSQMLRLNNTHFTSFLSGGFKFGIRYLLK